jgi:hypothetical protein
MPDVHDRMLVIPKPGNYDLWLDPGLKDAAAVTEMLRPFEARRMNRYLVSTRVNMVKNDDPECAAAIRLEWTNGSDAGSLRLTLDYCLVPALAELRPSRL